VTTDAGGGYNLGWMAAREWLKYTVNLTAAGTYAVDVRVALRGGGGRFHIEVNGVDKTGPIAVADIGGWQVWKTLTKTGVALTAGPRVIRVVMDSIGASGSVANFNGFAIRQAPEDRRSHRGHKGNSVLCSLCVLCEAVRTQS
jgi:Carbohydrate binding module (family 6)